MSYLWVFRVRTLDVGAAVRASLCDFGCVARSRNVHLIQAQTVSGGDGHLRRQTGSNQAFSERRPAGKRQNTHVIQPVGAERSQLFACEPEHNRLSIIISEAFACGDSLNRRIVSVWSSLRYHQVYGAEHWWFVSGGVPNWHHESVLESEAEMGTNLCVCCLCVQALAVD